MSGFHKKKNKNAPFSLYCPCFCPCLRVSELNTVRLTCNIFASRQKPCFALKCPSTQHREPRTAGDMWTAADNRGVETTMAARLTNWWTRHCRIWRGRSRGFSGSRAQGKATEAFIAWLLPFAQAMFRAVPLSVAFLAAAVACVPSIWHSTGQLCGQSLALTNVTDSQTGECAAASGCPECNSRFAVGVSAALHAVVSVLPLFLCSNDKRQSL